jgi:phytoene dehydrogenase-like protein
MGPRTDVIVVGAGLGGLVAAARLVQAGCQVLVLDRNPHVAGTAWVFSRAGFTFPMGPLGFSSPLLVQKTISELIPGSPLLLKRVHYRLRAFGLDLPLSLPRPDLQAAFIRSFPQEAMVGHQAFSALFLGGIPPALESGNRAAAYILEGKGPAAEFHLPGSLKK